MAKNLMQSYINDDRVKKKQTVEEDPKPKLKNIKNAGVNILVGDTEFEEGFDPVGFAIEELENQTKTLMAKQLIKRVKSVSDEPKYNSGNTVKPYNSNSPKTNYKK